MELNSLKELYVDELKDIYDAENQIIKALPKVAKAATSSELKNALQEHLEQTKGHVQRLEQIFESLGEKAKGKKCDGMKGLLEEGEKLMGEDADPAVMDAGLVAGAQRVEHYEMAVYGSLRTWANHLGEDSAAELLEQTLEEEKEADRKLTEIAESAVNVEAAQGDGTEQAAGASSQRKNKKARRAGA